MAGEGRRGNGPGGPLAPLPRQKPPEGNKCMRQAGARGGSNWMRAGEKRTTSLIELREMAPVLSVFTEKRKNEGFSLKSCAEYTKINDKFNWGFRGSPSSRRKKQRGRGREAPAPRSNAKRSGARAGPCAPFWLPQKGSTLHFLIQERSSSFSRLLRFIRAKCESAPPAPPGAMIDGR